MASVIKLKRSSTAGAAPTLSDLEVGELAINTKDQKIYSSNGTSVFQVFTGGVKAVSVGQTAVEDLTPDDLVVTSVTGFANSVVDNSLLTAKVSAATFQATLANTNAFIAAEVATVEGGTF
jgi:hypothetical protein|tara:strand:- start:6489 stop:6851 length:363 start_codon:yes stop_codon:yes gene_type:complete